MPAPARLRVVAGLRVFSFNPEPTLRHRLPG